MTEYSIFFVSKKTGSDRFYVDYQIFNKNIIKDRYPLSLIMETWECFRNKKWYTKLDIKEGYYQIYIMERYEWKIVFRIYYGYYKYLMMLFGFINISVIFQKMINEVFKEYLDIFVTIYLDDILIYLDIFEEYQWYIHLILSIFKKYNLLIESKKSFFYIQEIEYLDFIIRSDEFIMSPEKIKIVRNWHMSKNMKEARGFLGFTNFYRSLIIGYREIIGPFYMLIKKDTTFIWEKTKTDIFIAFKGRIITESIIYDIDLEKPYEVDIDISNFMIGVQLGQWDNQNKLYPIIFFSWWFYKVEFNYSIYNKEFIAIVEILKEW